jgi:hypothetical protein
VLIEKTLVALAGTNQIVSVDTIRHEGKLWLVPCWLEATAEGWSMPERIVCIDGLAGGDLAPEFHPNRRMLNDPIPKSVLDGETDTAEGRTYAVVEQPNIRIQVGRA